MKKIIAYFCLLLTIAVCLAYFFCDQNWNLKIPVAYNGDGLLSAVMVKTTIETGWYFKNPRLGAPASLNLLDYPMSEFLHFFYFWILSFFTSNWAKVLNLFFFTGFFASATTAFLVLLRLNISPVLSAIGAFSFALTPYHFSRGINHLFLSDYCAIPVISYLAIRIWDSQIHLNREWIQKTSLKRGLQFIAVCLLISSTGIYYAFFGIFFIMLSGIMNGIETKRPSGLLLSVLLSFGILLGVIANLAPSVIYHFIKGSNPFVGQRAPMETELYGLKPILLFLPSVFHPIKAFAHFTQRYYSSGVPLLNENTCATMGTLASFGLLASLIFPKQLRKFAIFFLISVLYCSIGGLGVLFSMVIHPGIRCTNRVSIFLTFFGIAAALILFQRWLDLFKNRIFQTGFLAFLILFLAFEHVNPALRTDSGVLKSNYLSDAQFIGQLEFQVKYENPGVQCAILQYPFRAFPESPPTYRSSDYDLFRGYLHSQFLSWS